MKELVDIGSDCMQNALRDATSKLNNESAYLHSY